MASLFMHTVLQRVLGRKAKAQAAKQSVIQNMVNLIRQELVKAETNGVLQVRLAHGGGSDLPVNHVTLMDDHLLINAKFFDGCDNPTCSAHIHEDVIIPITDITSVRGYTAEEYEELYGFIDRRE